MSHIKYRSKTKAESTPTEWLSVGTMIGDLTNQFAGRYDIIAYVGPGAGGGTAPACFTPATAEVEVDVNIAFNGVTPDMIPDLRIRANQFEFPKAMGAIFHEALHAKYSTWDIEAAFKALDPVEFRSLVLLEEGRIESKGVQTHPQNAGFLRAAAIELVIGDLKSDPIDKSGVAVAAQIAALTCARVDAGSLQDEDVASIMPIIEEKLGLEVFAQLREIWIAAQELPYSLPLESYYELARRWAKLVRETAKDKGEEEPGDGSGSGSGGAGDSTEETSGEATLREFEEALEDARENAAIGAEGDLDDQRTTEEWADEVKERSGKATVQKEHEKSSEEVYGKGTGPMADAHTGSRLVTTRKPTGPERAAAVLVARLLEKAKYRERDAVEIKSILPPGRLRTRAMVQGAALKDKGIMSQVEPWRRTQRKHTEDPTLNIGVMVDISGSMSWAMEPMGVAAWVLSEAVRRVQGRASMVYYGEGVFATLKPGQHLNDVTIYSAPDGTEKFDKAFKALNGAMNLLNGTGARLLVVISDGCYTHQETQRASHWMRECQRSGTAVLWLSMGGSSDADRITRSTGAQVVNMPTTATTPDVAKEIGEAAARALSSVGASA